ncbi:MAG: alpha/beta fold hydrolase [Acidimicrobiia bacterium]
MDVRIDGHDVFVHTGGVEFDPTLPVVVLIHGAGQDHSHFRFHTRSLAHGGIGVLAVDLPGHGRSRGHVLASVPEMAAWVIRLLDAVGVDRAVVVGHSMGSLIAIEAAAAHPERVAGIVLTGSAGTMAVHPDLQDAANRGHHLAVELISGWVHTGADRYGHHPQPGSWTRGITERLAERELERSLGPDLAACSSYRAAERAADVAAPATVVIGSADVMANPRAGRVLVEALPAAEVVELAGSGHNMVMDHPAEVRAAILDQVKAGFGRLD